MPAFFKAAGYRTFHVGKLDSVVVNQVLPPAFGWEEWSGGVLGVESTGRVTRQSARL